MYAVMIETDYMQKATFKKNFWEGFREVGGPCRACMGTAGVMGACAGELVGWVGGWKRDGGVMWGGRAGAAVRLGRPRPTAAPPPRLPRRFWVRTT